VKVKVGPTTNFKPIAVALVAIAVWLNSVGQLDAVPSPEQHEMSGTVRGVDPDTITIVPAGESKPVVFGWNKDTKFVRNGVHKCRRAAFGYASYNSLQPSNFWLEAAALPRDLEDNGFHEENR
jgi:hypothetical protein